MCRSRLGQPHQRRDGRSAGFQPGEPSPRKQDRLQPRIFRPSGGHKPPPPQHDCHPDAQRTGLRLLFCLAPPETSGMPVSRQHPRALERARLQPCRRARKGCGLQPRRDVSLWPSCRSCGKGPAPVIPAAPHQRRDAPAIPAAPHQRRDGRSAGFQPGEPSPRKHHRLQPRAPSERPTRSPRQSRSACPHPWTASPPDRLFAVPPKCGKTVKLFAPLLKCISLETHHFHAKMFGRFSAPTWYSDNRG